MKIITGLIVGFIYLWQLALLIIGCIPILIVAGVIVERVSKCYSRLCVATVLRIYMCINYCSLLYVRTCKCLYLYIVSYVKFVCKHVCVCVCTCVYMCVCTCMCTCGCTLVCVHVYALVYICVSVYICVYMCSYVRVYMCV